MRPDTIELLEKNICRTLSDINYRDVSLSPSARIMEIKTKINKWDLLKLKRFHTIKKTINKKKTQPKGWENMCKYCDE